MAGALITQSVGVAKYGVPVMNPGATELVTFTTSTQSGAFDDDTAFIRVIADADVFLAFGEAPTATATSIKMKADTVEYFAVRPGEKVACYDGSS